MTTSDNAIMQQFLAGRADGPIGMDEMADTDTPTVSRSASGPVELPTPSVPLAAGS
jgi:hypothetical protein